MNIQDFVNAQMSKMREEQLANSDQLLFGELLLKIETVKDKNKPVVFDFGMKPSDVMSWRGSYCELGLGYSEGGGGTASVNTDKVSWQSDDGEYKSYEHETFELPENPTTQDFLTLLKLVLNREMVGYKGGDFKMHKNVSVYFANHSESSVHNYKGKEYATVVPLDVIEHNDKVEIITGEVDY